MDELCASCSAKLDVDDASTKPVCRMCYLLAERDNQSSLNRRSKDRPEMDEIVENIFVGTEVASADGDFLKEKKVTHVLNLLPTPFTRHPDITYLNIQVEDRPDFEIISLFEEAIEFLKTAKVTLIHCVAGQSRSPSFLIAYLIKEKGMSFEEAYALVKSKRIRARPNDGFLEQLQKYEKLVRGGETKTDGETK
mmetsp:Transcript_71419/g.83085  ORF Transcript_71419/g.83085 Transcript_71419/m.83085 type:complete len:194 (-) Transcript_71419:141-722(-)